MAGINRKSGLFPRPAFKIKRVEKRLEKIKQLIMPLETKGLLDQAPQFIWTTGPDDIKVVYGNRTFLDFLGFTHIDQLAEAAFWQVCLHPDDLGNMIEIHSGASSARIPCKLEARFREAGTGAYCWYLIQSIPRFDLQDEFLGYIWTAVDISTRKEAELKLQESEDRFRIMAEGTEILIAVSDETSNATYFNRAWVELTGRPMEYLLKFGWADLLHPDDREHYMDVYLTAFEKKEAFTSEFRVLNKDGGYTWLLVKCPPRTRMDGSFAGYISSCVDITDRKQAEEKLRVQEKILEDLVSTRTRQLEQSNADLQQFVHVASHDLMEPVRKIKNFLSRILYESGNDLPEKARIYFNKIQGAADRMAEMIKGTLAYSTAGNGDQLFKPVDLNSILQNIKTDLELVIQQKGATVQVAEVPAFEGIPVMVYQLFYNLINNSLKFSKKEELPFISITSTIIHQDGRVFARFVVKDNGIGFEPEQAGRIFDTFVRLHSKDKYEGTGLGLALCKKIVQRHNGTIEAKGLGGAGSEFIVILPLKHDVPFNKNKQ